MKDRGIIILSAFMLLLIAGCSTTRKLDRIRAMESRADINLPETHMLRKLDTAARKIEHDTITVNIDGHEMVLMKAIKDEESGEMVAHEQLDAAFVTARFRNIAERRGKADLEFQIRVPETMLDNKWQLRFFPNMFIGEDTHSLEPVYITGKDYRKVQLKGYQQYQRFLNSIITDSSEFINLRLLEIFLKRNLPQIYAFKDSDIAVSDEEFYSNYGYTERMAVEHYTNEMKVRRNNRRIGRKDDMFRKYVKVPIITEGLRLDSIYQDKGAFVYNYVQTIDITRNIKKVDIVMNGDIYEETNRIYGIPYTDPLSFYISSLSAFVDNTVRYKKAIVSRRVEANTSGYIDFEMGKSEVKRTLFNNEAEIGRIEGVLASLLENETFDLDSVMVTAFASPEGSVSLNTRLSSDRARSVSAYFKKSIGHIKDSIINSRGFSVNIDGSISREEMPDIRLMSRNGGENWNKFETVIKEDESLTQSQKDYFNKCMLLTNLDDRENALKLDKDLYKYCKENIYPRLRTVKFDFYLHRKGMVQDTVHTTVLDTTYMDGVQAIRDRDYERAIALLAPYNDYNTAVAYCAMDRNQSALAILEKMERTAEVNYMLAILYSRGGETEKAVQHYLTSCEQDRTYINRGNLDPEISTLIRAYGLNAVKEEEYDIY